MQHNEYVIAIMVINFIYIASVPVLKMSTKHSIHYLWTLVNSQTIIDSEFTSPLFTGIGEVHQCLGPLDQCSHCNFRESLAL